MSIQRILLNAAAFAAASCLVIAPSFAAQQMGKPHDYTPPPADVPIDDASRRGDSSVPTEVVPTAIGAPEIAPAALGSLAALLVGGALLLQARRRPAQR